MIWYSYNGIPYKGNCPAYYNLSDKVWFAELSANQQKIKSLVLDYLKQENIEVEKYFNESLVTGKENWKVSPFLFWGKQNKKNISKSQELYSMLENIPGLTGLSISILPPQTSVKPHYGDTDAVYRVHIPVKIPSALPVCGLKVKGIEKCWEENRPLVFCDAHLHEAWNLSNETRIVLIADILREDCVSDKNNICKNVLSLLWLQQMTAKYHWLNSLPAFSLGILRLIFKTSLYFKA